MPQPLPTGVKSVTKEHKSDEFVAFYGTSITLSTGFSSDSETGGTSCGSFVYVLMSYFISLNLSKNMFLVEWLNHLTNQ